MDAIPCIDLTTFRCSPGSPKAKRDCAFVAKVLGEVGVIRIRDPNRSQQDADCLRERTVDLFRQPEEVKQQYDRPEFGRNGGWTPPFTEGPNEELAARARMRPGHEAEPLRGKDPKERWMIPIGPAPLQTNYPEYNQKIAVYPPSFEDWFESACRWSNRVLHTVFTIIEMAMVGFGEPDRCIITRDMCFGPHFFAPTGTNLLLHGKPGTVFAGLHNDMGIASIHEQANAPGLRVWTRNFERVDVAMQPGELLLQAGSQLQICTGGRILAGLHEGVSNHGMQPLIQAEQEKGLVPWRVSRTLFTHIGSDKMLGPRGIFNTPEARKMYKDRIQLAGERMRAKLAKRGLGNG